MMVPQFSWSDRYNIWSGILGGMFLALAYFGCDQSQVQRYLTGKSLKDSRMSLLFNGVAKIPLQMFILFIGAIVFSFYNFEKPPIVFDQTASIRSKQARIISQVIQRYDAAFEQRRAAAMQLARGQSRKLRPACAPSRRNTSRPRKNSTPQEPTRSTWRKRPTAENSTIRTIFF